MKWIKRIAAIAGLLALLLGAAVAITLYIETHPRAHEFAVTRAGVLTESEAITITHEAISRSGRNQNEFTALAWGTREWEGKPERVFARNTIDPNDGYVIWKHSSGDPARTLRVSIEKHETAFKCKVHRAK